MSLCDLKPQNCETGITQAAWSNGIASRQRGVGLKPVGQPTWQDVRFLGRVLDVKTGWTVSEALMGALDGS